MNLHEYKRRYLIKILSYAKGGMEITKEEATKGIGFLSPRKATTKAKAFKRARSARKGAKSEKHRASTKEIRDACLERSDGKCEWCHLMEFNSSFAPPHMHHMAGGAGQRREKQSIANVVMLCEYCHRGYHNRPADPFYRRAALTHCRTHGYPVPPCFLRASREQVPAPQAPESLPERIAK